MTNGKFQLEFDFNNANRHLRKQELAIKALMQTSYSTYLQFPTLLAPYDASKCKIRCQLE